MLPYLREIERRCRGAKYLVVSDADILMNEKVSLFMSGVCKGRVVNTLEVRVEKPFIKRQIRALYTVTSRSSSTLIATLKLAFLLLLSFRIFLLLLRLSGCSLQRLLQLADLLCGTIQRHERGGHGCGGHSE